MLQEVLSDVGLWDTVFGRPYMAEGVLVMARGFSGGRCRKEGRAWQPTDFTWGVEAVCLQTQR